MIFFTCPNQDAMDQYTRLKNLKRVRNLFYLHSRSHYSILALVLYAQMGGVQFCTLSFIGDTALLAEEHKKHLMLLLQVQLNVKQ